MRSRHNNLLPLIFSCVLVIFLQVLLSGSLSAADLEDKLTNADCRVIEETNSESNSVAKFSNAVLWKVSNAGKSPSYVFGTIHVSDPRVTNLPEPPGVIWTYFSPISPFVFIDAIASS